MIKVNNLSKHYKIPVSEKGVGKKIVSLFSPKYSIIKAVDKLDCQINEGEIVGYLGPNGAGKSTTIKLLTGILHPTSGEITINNINPYKCRKLNAQNIGVVFGQRNQLWWDLPLIDSFEIMKAIYKIPKNKYKARLDELVSRLKIEEIMNQTVRRLSLGQRMKGNIIASLLHFPKIIYLDEPTLGLDFVSKNSILEFFSEINRNEKITILFTSHQLSDIVKICKRVILINKGKILIDNNINEVLALSDCKILKIVFKHQIPSIGEWNFQVVKKENNIVYFKYNKKDESMNNLLTKLSRDDDILDFSLLEEDIEDIIKEYYMVSENELETISC